MLARSTRSLALASALAVGVTAGAAIGAPPARRGRLVPGGLEVSIGGTAGVRMEVIAGVSVVWSASPCSLLVVDRRLRASGDDELTAMRLKPPSEAKPLTIRLERRGFHRISTPVGETTAERVDLNGRRTTALIRVRSSAWMGPSTSSSAAAASTVIRTIASSIFGGRRDGVT